MNSSPDETFRLLIGRWTLAFEPRRLLLAFAATILMGLWAGIGYEIWKDRSDSLEEWTRNLSNLTRAFGEHTLRSISAVDQDVKFLRNQYVRSGAVDVGDLVRQGAMDAKAYDHIGIVNGQGVYVRSSIPFQPVNVGDRDYYQAQATSLRDDAFIGKPVVSRVSNKWTIHFSRRIIQADGSFGGIVVASMTPSFLSALYNDVDLGERGVISLTGEDGIVRARRYDGRGVLGDSVKSAPIFTQFKGQQSGTYVFQSVRDQHERLYTFYRLQGYPLVIAIGVSMDHIYQRSNERRTGYLLIGCAGSLVVILFAALLGRLLGHLSGMVEIQRESRIQAESANKLKSEFLANMSHELRTPLNGILGFADILRRKASSEQDRRKSEIIHTSGTHLLSLLNSILDLAKIEAGKMEVYLRQEELIPLIRDTVQIYEVAATEKGLTLHTLCSTDLPDRVHCDTTMLRQVLNNLISNAIKFTDAGSITIRVERADAPELLQFSVRDTGMGIPKEAAELVFEKFRQVDQSMTRTHQGTGLGLNLAKQLVELMGGTIRLQSALGEGTTITFTMPTGNAGSDTTGAAVPARESLPGKAAANALQ